MWCPPQDLDAFNRLLVALEQAYLAVLRNNGSAAALIAAPDLAALCARVDADPYTAVAMTRIKSGHTMTPRHGLNTAMLARAWAVSRHKLGGRLDSLTHAALLHDLGHWRPDDLLFVFEYFSHDQYRRMQEHPRAATDDLPLSDEARTWVAQHHEQVDGKGYPEGMRDPHPLAQVLRICDCWDGLTTPRRFRPAYTAVQAMTLMDRWAGYKYDAGLFQSFFEFMGGAYPVGSFVRLKDGSMAAVLPEARILPVTNAQGDALEDPAPESLSDGEIVAEAQTWQQTPLPKSWRTLRPDLLNLPRFY